MRANYSFFDYRLFIKKFTSLLQANVGVKMQDFLNAIPGFLGIIIVSLLLFYIVKMTNISNNTPSKCRIKN